MRAISKRLEQFNLTRDIQERVARNERDGRLWASHLRALMGGSPFRTMGQNPDALWHLLENPVASTDARVGAAVALRMSSPEPDTRGIDSRSSPVERAPSSAACGKSRVIRWLAIGEHRCALSTGATLDPRLEQYGAARGVRRVPYSTDEIQRRRDSWTPPVGSSKT